MTYLIDVPPVLAMIIEASPKHSHHQAVGLSKGGRGGGGGGGIHVEDRNISQKTTVFDICTFVCRSLD